MSTPPIYLFLRLSDDELQRLKEASVGDPVHIVVLHNGTGTIDPTNSIRPTVGDQPGTVVSCIQTTVQPKNSGEPRCLGAGDLALLNFDAANLEAFNPGEFLSTCQCTQAKKSQIGRVFLNMPKVYQDRVMIFVDGITGGQHLNAEIARIVRACDGITPTKATCRKLGSLLVCASELEFAVNEEANETVLYDSTTAFFNKAFTAIPKAERFAAK